jgi:hypothetical protein
MTHQSRITAVYGNMSLFVSTSRLVSELLQTHGLTAVVIISMIKLLLVLT